MASANNNKGKEPLKDVPQDPKLYEEAKEKSPQAQPRATLSSIEVVARPLTIRRTVWMSTRGKVPRHTLASSTPSSVNNNPYRNLIHKYPYQKVPESKLPSGWNRNRSNSAGKESSQYEECWGNNSKSWDSKADMLMNRVDHNTELIRNLTYKIDELQELVEKLIKDSPSTPKE